MNLSALCLFFLVPALSAQSIPAQRAVAIAALSQADPSAPVDISDSLLTSAHGTSRWALERGHVFLSAAILAKDHRRLARMEPLLQAAQSNLLAARAAGDLPPVERANCAHLLGTLAERGRGDIAAAAAYYQEAVNNDPGNRQAADALARMRAILSYRQSLNH